jgi:hypothetical protein
MTNQTGEKGKIWPENLDEAVKQILSVMPMTNRATLRKMERDELLNLHFCWGIDIRNRLGLWEGNEALMRDCKANHPDDASRVIIEAVWVGLQKGEIDNV